MSSVLRTLVHVCIVLAIWIEARILPWYHWSAYSELDLVSKNDYSSLCSLNECSFLVRKRAKIALSFKLHYEL